DGIRDLIVTGVQTCALPILLRDAVGVVGSHDAELRSVGVDDADLPGTDLGVDARLLFDLGYAAPPGTQASAAVRATNMSSARLRSEERRVGKEWGDRSAWEQ